MFLVHVIDLPNVLRTMSHNCCSAIYADDTFVVVIPSHFKYLEPGAQEILINKWCSNINSILKIEKTECSIVHTERSVIDFSQESNLENCVISGGSTIQVLGSYINTNLKCDSYITSFNERLTSPIYSLNLLRNNIRQYIKQIL